MRFLVGGVPFKGLSDGRCTMRLADLANALLGFNLLGLASATAGAFAWAHAAHCRKLEQSGY
jgi:hypothetical protein